MVFNGFLVDLLKLQKAIEFMSIHIGRCRVPCAGARSRSRSQGHEFSTLPKNILRSAWGTDWMSRTSSALDFFLVSFLDAETTHGMDQWQRTIFWDEQHQILALPRSSRTSHYPWNIGKATIDSEEHPKLSSFYHLFCCSLIWVRSHQIL